MRPSAKPLAFVLAAACFGCSSGLDGVEKRLASMQEEITRLQNQNDRLVERVDAIEGREAQAQPAPSGAPKAAPAAVSERPPLKVVKVVPEDSAGMPSAPASPPAPSEAADDPTPRPMIRLRGTGKPEGRGDQDRSDDGVAMDDKSQKRARRGE